MKIVIRKINEKGIGLVEVVAALGISVLVLTSLVSLSLFTLRSSLASKLQLEGTKMANREIELVRAFRDSSESWYKEVSGVEDGFLYDVMPCYNFDNTCYMDGLTVVGGKKIEGAGAETLTRYFTATKIDGSPLTAASDADQEVRIHVVVTWMIGDDSKQTNLYTDLTNWEKK